MTVRWPRFAAAAAGLAWYLHLAGRTINPFNSDWLSGDWIQHWTGFLFFKQESWTFPLGRLVSIPYPIGTSIGFTDSNPLVSIALKPFAHVLPAEFQFIGLWLFLCFGLQGYFGALLCSTVTGNRLHQALGGSLFALSPVLTTRVGHDTLCAHWLVLALLYLGLRRCDDAVTGRRLAIWSVAGVYVAATIHPYLAAMCFVLAMASLGRLLLAKTLPIRNGVLFLLSMAAGTALIFWAIGYFGEEGAATGGFGDYSTDLLAFFDARGTSQWLPTIPTRPKQWEGFAFPGIGGWFAIAAATVWILRRPLIDWRHRKVVVWAAIVLAIYALSSDITWAGHTIARTRRLYRLVEPIPSLFRASGRFIWPLHYLALLYGVWGIARLGGPLRRFGGTALLCLALVFQVLDFTMDSYWFADKHLRQANPGSFALVRGHYEHLALFPLQIAGGCDTPLDEPHVYRYSLLATRLGLTFNSGTFARIAPDKVDELCSALARQVEAGQLDSHTLYIVSPDSVKLFRAASAVCNKFDGDWACVSTDGAEPFRTFLETGRLPSSGGK